MKRIIFLGLITSFFYVFGNLTYADDNPAVTDDVVGQGIPADDGVIETDTLDNGDVDEYIPPPPEGGGDEVLPDGTPVEPQDNNPTGGTTSSGTPTGNGGQTGSGSSGQTGTSSGNNTTPGNTSSGSGQTGTSTGNDTTPGNTSSGSGQTDASTGNGTTPENTSSGSGQPSATTGDKTTSDGVVSESGKSETTSDNTLPEADQSPTEDTTQNSELSELPYADQWAEGSAGAAVIIDLHLDKPAKLTIKASPNSYDVLDNGTITYLPKPGFLGVDTFAYSYTDDDGQEITQVARVTIGEDTSGLSQTAACQIYATHSEDNTDSQLVTIDPVGYTATALGPFYKTFDIEGIAINPANRLLYAISGTDAPNSLDGRLYAVNARTGELRMIGDTGLTGITDLAFRADGTLWSWSKKRGIIQVDPETAQSTVVFTPEPSVVIETKDPKPVSSQSNTTPTTGNRDTTPVATPPATDTSVEDTAMTGAVLFVEDSGLREKRYVMPNIKGLAWNAEGTILYATERVYSGKMGRLWAYDGQSFQSVCDNLPPRIDGLETLPDGLLMFAIREKYGNQIYVYDPKRCEVVLNRSFVTQYPNLEDVAWPLDCQPLPELQSWKFKFDEAKNTSMCLDEAHWITLKGVAMLDPPESQAYLETSWQIIKPKDVTCPPSDSLIPPKDNYCTKLQLAARQNVTGHSEFSITGWWPGIPKDAPADFEVEVRYTAQLLDLNGQLVPGSSKIVKTLKANPDLCNPTSETTVTEESAPSEETSDVTDDSTEETPAAEKTLTCQGITPQLPLDTKALRDYFAQLVEKGMPYEDKTLKVEGFTLDENRIISVLIEGQRYYGILGLPLESTEESDELVLAATDDVNDDGLNDFTVTYPDGQVQTLIYFGTQAPSCQIEDNTSVVEEGTTEPSDAATPDNQDTGKPEDSTPATSEDGNDANKPQNSGTSETDKPVESEDKPQDTGESDKPSVENKPQDTGESDKPVVENKPQDTGESDKPVVGDKPQDTSNITTPVEDSPKPVEPVVETPVAPPAEVPPAPVSESPSTEPTDNSPPASVPETGN